MQRISHVCFIALLTCATSAVAVAADRLYRRSTLPVYDHIVIVVEENKDFEQIFGAKFDAPYLNKLATEGASIGNMFGEEHNSQGNYFWLFSGSNQNVGFLDQVPSVADRRDYPFKTSNLGEQLIKKDFSFKGYAESLPAIGSKVDFDPPNCTGDSCVYGRKHVPFKCPERDDNQYVVKSGITIRTVKEHRGRVMEKMEANSLAELVTMIVTLRLHETRIARPNNSQSDTSL